MSTVSGHLLSLIVAGSSLSAVFDRLLSFIAGSGFLSTVFGHLSSLITSGGPLSTVFGRLSSLVAGSSPLSAISSDSPLSTMPSSGSGALFLTSTPSHTRRSSLPSLLLFYSSLPSLPIPLARN